jgi:hypothetical protein
MSAGSTGIRILLSDLADRDLAVRLASHLCRAEGFTEKEEQAVLAIVEQMAGHGALYARGCGELGLGRDGSGGIRVHYFASKPPAAAPFDCSGVLVRKALERAWPAL